MSVHRKIITNYSQKMQSVWNLCIFNDALDVSGCSRAHHQEHITVHTASGIVNQYCCQLLPRRRWNLSQFHLLHGSN